MNGHVEEQRGIRPRVVRGARGVHLQRHAEESDLPSICREHPNRVAASDPPGAVLEEQRQNNVSLRQVGERGRYASLQPWHVHEE
jgi:hypothetical protein